MRRPPLGSLLPPNAITQWRASLVDAEMQEVLERIDVRRGDIRVGREIGLRVEACRRIAAFLPAVLVVVLERIRALAATSLLTAR